MDITNTCLRNLPVNVSREMAMIYTSLTLRTLVCTYVLAITYHLQHALPNIRMWARNGIGGARLDPYAVTVKKLIGGETMMTAKIQICMQY